jgi:hypothetical protein
VPPSGELYIRYSATDHGERDIPPGTQYWLSPAIEIDGSGLGSTVIAAGKNQTVKVHVGNQGSNSHDDVNVQVYATNWGTVNPWLQSLGGPVGTPAGPFTVLGSAQGEAIVEIGWHPSTTELDGQTEKHVCLFANVYRTGDGAPQSNPPDFGDIVTNQHHAQCNMTLKAVPLGSHIGSIVHAGNILGEREEFLLEVRETAGTRLDALDKRHLAAAPWLERAQKKVGTTLPLHTKAGALGLELKGKPVKAPRPELRLTLDPGQQVPLVLTAKPSNPKQPGLHRFTILQRRAKTGELVGGARLLVAVLPKQLIPKPLLIERPHEIA